MNTALYETAYFTDTCSPKCSGCDGFCSLAGLRPFCTKKSRCRHPCGEHTNKCGGGGCCGSGCRGGCGKPGQLCLPLRSCPNPPCQSLRNSGKSTCLPPTSNAHQPPCCKIPQIMGISGNRSGKSSPR
ncbi:keratin-associated protein 5-1-like [Belonocnema kinseyi]|uniref:keratin-associated protein 5-1-like n=1 Tax=Belonocnema kinseyi TaxID=2817044 RepID=UPI00143D8BD1|nr:keratin-associated protein 5-1-like [Belonocnema kinseyi]